MYAHISDHGSNSPAVKDVKYAAKLAVKVNSELPTTLARNLSPTLPESKDEVELTAEQLKKRCRNERDRRRNCVKRETMEQMRKAVAALELQKQQLMQHFRVTSPCSSPDSNYPSPSSSPDLMVSTSYISTSRQVTRDNYVQLTTEIEELRRQNAVMVQKLSRRDLFYNSLRYRLSSFPRLDCLSGMHTIQLTHSEGVSFVRRTLRRIHEVRLPYASEDSRLTFLGWSQDFERRGEFVTIGVKKELRNVTPQQLIDKSWELQMNDDNLRQLGPSHVQVHSTVLQKITDNTMIIDRRTEDHSEANESGRQLVLRTMHVLFRDINDNGTQTICIKTLDVPVADRMLRDDEVWWDNFFWIRVSPANPTSAGNQVTAVVELCSIHSCGCENLITLELHELIYLAIRWETAVAAPLLLKQ